MFEPGRFYRCHTRFWDARGGTWVNIKSPVLCIESKRHESNSVIESYICLFLAGEKTARVVVEEYEFDAWEEYKESNV